MKIPAITVLLLSLTFANADDTVRSAAYRIGDEQAQIHLLSTELVAELDAILLEIERNGLSEELKSVATASRESLSSARDGPIVDALSQLREMSVSGKTDGAVGILQQQQEAELALRTIAHNLAVKQFTEQAAALSSAIIARQEKAIAPIGKVADKPAALAEQQSIALQVEDLVAALSSAPTDLPPALSNILKQAADAAADLKLTTKAAAAATAKKNKLRPLQEEVRASLASVDQILAAMTPAAERLEQAAADLKQMQSDLASLKSEKKSDPSLRESLASKAEATARQVASETPPATAALKDARNALRENSPESLASAEQSLAEAAKAIDEQLTRTAAAEQATPLQAAAAAREDARLASLEAAVATATQENLAVGDALESKTPGEAADKALQTQPALDQLAAQAALAAQMFENQPNSKKTLASTFQATATAASEALRAAQAASRGDVASAKQSNAEATEALSMASASLAERREALRSQLGLPTSEQPSGNPDTGTQLITNSTDSSPAELALRKIADNLAVKQFTEQAAALSSAIIARQEKAIAPIGKVADKPAALAEQQSIALQVEDLVAALSSAPTDLPPALSNILKQAADAAADLKLTTKAAAAATAKENELRPLQEEVRASLASVDQILAAMTPAADRLEQAAADLKQMQSDLASLKSEKKSDPSLRESLASKAEATARQVASETPPATAALKDARKALSENSPESLASAEQSLAEAAKAIDEQLARTAAAEQATPLQAAVALNQLANEARQLTKALKAAEGQQTDPGPLVDQVESLQSRTAPVSPEAAASMADAAGKIESLDEASAAAAMEASAQQLASQAQQAAAAAQEDARLASLEAAVETASRENQAVGDALESKTPGEAADKALQTQPALDQLAAQAALAAQMFENQPNSKKTLASTFQATATAASEALRAAQAASRGDVASAKQSNAEATEALSMASASLAERREALRSQLGLPTSEQPSGSSSSDGADIGEGTNQLIASSSDPAPTPDLDVNRGFSPEVRQAMGELRKTPVPTEYSGPVQSYFKKLAAE